VSGLLPHRWIDGFTVGRFEGWTIGWFEKMGLRVSVFQCKRGGKNRLYTFIFKLGIIE
jgi:hypothetical protein